MTERYRRNGKQVIADNLHFADARNEDAAAAIVRAMNLAAVATNRWSENVAMSPPALLNAVDQVQAWEDEWIYSEDNPHWGDRIAWSTARDIAKRLDDREPRRFASWPPGPIMPPIVTGPTIDEMIAAVRLPPRQGLAPATCGTCHETIRHNAVLGSTCGCADARS